MSSAGENLIAKEKEVEISRLKHNILEAELKKLKKLKEVEQIEQNIKQYEKILAEKEGV